MDFVKSQTCEDAVPFFALRIGTLFPSKSRPAMFAARNSYPGRGRTSHQSKSLTRGRSPARLLLSRRTDWIPAANSTCDRLVGDATKSYHLLEFVTFVAIPCLRCCLQRSVSPPSGVGMNSVLLPGLGQNDIECAAVVALQNIVGREASAGVAGSVFERRVASGYVSHHEIDADVLEIRIDRRVTRVIAERHIEQVLRRFQIAVTVDRAVESPARQRAARRYALSVHVRRCGLRMEEVRIIVDETGHAPRTVAPAQTCPVMHPRERFDAGLRNPAERGERGMECIVDNVGGVGLGFVVQIVSADHADVEGADG